MSFRPEADTKICCVARWAKILVRMFQWLTPPAGMFRPLACKKHFQAVGIKKSFMPTADKKDNSGLWAESLKLQKSNLTSTD